MVIRTNYVLVLVLIPVYGTINTVDSETRFFKTCVLRVVFHLTGTHAPFANTTLLQQLILVRVYIPIKIYRSYVLQINTVVKNKNGEGPD